MEFALFGILLLGLSLFFIQYLKCYKSNDPGLIYADKALKTQLFRLSKHLVYLFLITLIIFCIKRPENMICNRIIIPLSLSTILYVTINCLPNNQISSFQFACESGVKNYEKFSPYFGRFYGIIFLGISIVLTGAVTLLIQIYYLITNTYLTQENVTIAISRSILDMLNDDYYEKYKIGFGCLNSCATSSNTIVFLGLALAIIFVIMNEIIYLIEYRDILKGNKGKTGILRNNYLILLKRQLSVAGVVLMIVNIITTYMMYYSVYNLLLDPTTLDLYKYRFINKLSVMWYNHNMTILITIGLVLSAKVIILMIKLLIILKHKKEVIKAINKQNEINNDPHYDQYKGYDFTSKVLDYQFNVFRIMYEPSILKDKSATIKNIKEMIEYSDALSLNRPYIFMAIPCIVTNDLVLSFKCYKEQLKNCSPKK